MIDITNEDDVRRFVWRAVCGKEDAIAHKRELETLSERLMMDAEANLYDDPLGYLWKSQLANEAKEVVKHLPG